MIFQNDVLLTALKRQSSERFTNSYCHYYRVRNNRNTTPGHRKYGEIDKKSTDYQRNKPIK